MVKQYFDWGWVDWFDNEMQFANIGISYINPHTEQGPHIHHENEQWLYVLEGSGVYGCNGEEYHLVKGDSLYFPFDAVHTTRNDNDTYLVDLIVSISKKSYATNYWNISTARYLEYNNDLNAAIDALNLADHSPKTLDYKIYDASSQQIIYTTDSFVPNEAFDIDEIVTGLHPGDISREIAYFPIQDRDDLFGYILVDLGTIMDEYDFHIPESTRQSIRKFFNELSKGLASFCQFNKWQRELYKASNTLSLDKNIENIKEDLVFEKEISRNLKINQHFLFNTLNNMAEMALNETNLDLYDSIILLSDMFRYSSEDIGHTSSLADELKYLNSYIQLQQMRYKDNLDFQLEVPEDLLEVVVPVNLLQPIVENSFTHGFINYNDVKRIKIRIREGAGQGEGGGEGADSRADSLVISVMNNGVLPDMSTIKNIRKNMKLDNNHGLSMLYHKLRHTYNDNFMIDFINKDGNFIVELTIPRG